MNVHNDRRVVQALGICFALATLFYAVAMAVSPNGPWYLLTNLLLGAVPFLLTYPLLKSVERHGWIDWRSVAWGLTWLGFLPNSFYVLTDLVHLINKLHVLDPFLGIIVFSLCGFVGMAMGLVSVVAVHRPLLKRLGPVPAYVVVEVVLWLSCMAIYLGRSLRWNTWDVVLHPADIARDVLGGALIPSSEGIELIVMFFALLSGLYAAAWTVWGVTPDKRRQS